MVETQSTCEGVVDLDIMDDLTPAQVEMQEAIAAAMFGGGSRGGSEGGSGGGRADGHRVHASMVKMKESWKRESESVERYVVHLSYLSQISLVQKRESGSAERYVVHARATPVSGNGWPRCACLLVDG